MCSWSKLFREQKIAELNMNVNVIRNSVVTWLGLVCISSFLLCVYFVRWDCSVLDGAKTPRRAHNSHSSSVQSAKKNCAQKNSTRTMMWLRSSFVTNSLLLLALGVCLPLTGHSFSASSLFHGNIMAERQSTMAATMLTMRKQKASDRRTRRMQRGDDAVVEPQTLTSSPMALARWQHKTLTKNTATIRASPQTGGRGRSRKRSNLYNTLSSYHGTFLSLLTAEYHSEVRFSFGHCDGSCTKTPVQDSGRIFVWYSAHRVRLDCMNLSIFWGGNVIYLTLSRTISQPDFMLS